MFEKRDAAVNFPEIEHKVLAYWQEKQIFKASVEQRQGAKAFSFYDGPPFATGLPHYGHILAGAIKDTVLRYKTMKGFYSPRTNGWDCHGLPVEYEIEKERHIAGKQEIEAMGVDTFNEACRSIVFRYTKEWDKTISRMGRWVDFEHSYATMDKPYMESIWWVFKQIWDKGLVYEDFRSTWFCPRCGTPLSNFEVNQGYRDDVEDPSIFVKMQLEEDPNTYFLVWTTTPWTLPGNAAIAANPDFEYVKIKLKDQASAEGQGLSPEQIEAVGQHFILSKERLSVISQPYEIVKTYKAKDLEGKKYRPLYGFQTTEKKAHYLVLADFVTQDDGTGLVHIAPAFGEDDFNLAKQLGLPVFRTVDERGALSREVTPWAGIFVKEADPLIAEELLKRGLRYHLGTIKHTYPFCWRCDSPLLNYALKTWFIEVSKIRDRLIANNALIHWVPEHIRDGRFGKWLENARDWNVSRNRYWGTPLPIWRCDGCSHTECVGSLDELKAIASPAFKNQIDGIDLHRPYIDKVEAECPKCSKTMHRIEEVLDCWFESGSMPYAERHYPFENKAEFEANFPAQFIAEGMDQTRGWFYTLHVIATILFDKPAFQNVIVNGIGLDEKGVKLSKRLRNYVEPEKLMDSVGADAMRYFLFAGTPMGEDWRFSDDLVKEKMRKVLMTLWNSYVFFLTYALIDGFKPMALETFRPAGLMDQWILSRLHTLVKTMTEAFERYDLTNATRPIEEFASELSTWYIRRSRRRFWKSENDGDKIEAYQTLYTVLVTVAKLIAPITPFVADEIYLNLVTGIDDNAPLSVHLTDYPEWDANLVNPELEKQMAEIKELVEAVRAMRSELKLKVRQPLAHLAILTEDQALIQTHEQLLLLLGEEVNVKEISFVTVLPEGYVVKELKFARIALNTIITPELKAEGMMRDLVREIQSARKQAGFEISDHIRLTVSLPAGELTDALHAWQDYLKKETLCNELVEGTAEGQDGFAAEFQLDKQAVKAVLRRMG